MIPAALAAFAAALLVTAFPQAGEYRSELSNGGATLTYRVWPTDLTVAQRIRVELTVTAPPGWSVSWPAVGDKLGRATVVDTADARDGLKQSRTITLEPYLPGEDAIPSLSVSVSPRDPQAGAAPVTLTTEPVPLAIKALLAESDPDANAVPELRGVRDGSNGGGGVPAWLIGVGAAGFVGLAGAAYVAATRRRTPPVDPAHAALARLEAVAAAAAPASTPARDAALDEIAHAAREFLQARGVENAVGAATPDLPARIARVPLFAGAAPRVGELLAAVDAVRFDPRREPGVPATLAAELAGVLRPALTPQAPEHMGGGA